MVLTNAERQRRFRERQRAAAQAYDASIDAVLAKTYEDAHDLVREEIAGFVQGLTLDDAALGAKSRDSLVALGEFSQSTGIPLDLVFQWTAQEFLGSPKAVEKLKADYARRRERASRRRRLFDRIEA